MAKIKKFKDLITDDFDLLSISYVVWNEFKNKPSFSVSIGYGPGEKREKYKDNMWAHRGMREDSEEIESIVANKLNLKEHPNLSSSWMISPEEFNKIITKCESLGFEKSYYNDTERRNPQKHTYLTIKCDKDSLVNIINDMCS